MRFCVAVFLLASALRAQSGHWEGVIKQENRDALFSVDLDRDPEWQGSFVIPGQDAPPLPLSGIVVELPSVAFEIRELPGNPTFKGVLAEAGTSLRGTVTQGSRTVAFEMRKLGEAHVERAPPNSPLTRAFWGNWSGTLGGGRDLKLALRLRNDDDGLGSGALDTADRRASNLILSAIRQVGRSLSFDVRLIAGKFQGELSADESRITGEWTQGGNSMPLAFERVK